jgi:hypothetical protein
METHYNWTDLLLKYIKGTIQLAELTELNRQKAEDPGKQEEFNRLMDPDGFREDSRLAASLDTDKAWKKFVAAHPALDQKKARPKRHPRRKIWQSNYLYWAILLVIVMGLLHLWVRWMGQQ